MVKVVHVRALEDYRLELQFDDGITGVVDLSSHAGKGVFEIWNDYNTFRSVEVGPYGELRWGDVVDLCPDALYLEVTGKKPADLFPKLRSERVDAGDLPILWNSHSHEFQ